MFSHIVFDHDGTLVDTSSYKRVLYPGLKSVLLSLHEKKVKLYVWTARDRKSTLESLKDLEISHLFEDINTSSDEFNKPDTRSLKALVAGVDKESVCIIGDSPHDMSCAKAFGAFALGACWGHEDASAKNYLLKSGADECCAISELEEILMKEIKNV